MSTNISVKNLPFTVTAEAMRTRCSPDGTLASGHLMTDRETGQVYGCGFVAMTTEGPGVGTTLDYTALDGWRLRVRCAHARDACSSPVAQ
jgi:hypothetical protein